MTSDQLTLRAQGEEDISIFSALLQDALFKVGDFHWSPTQKTLAAVCNRYKWDKKKRFFGRKPKRARCAFHFSSVLKVETQGINFKDKDQILNLLTIEYSAQDGIAAILTLLFSGGASMRLHVECVEAVLSDVSEEWDAKQEPRHAP